MTTSHLCNGKWRPGSNEDCTKHKRLSKKQISVYRSSEKSSGSGGDAPRSAGGSKSDSA